MSKNELVIRAVSMVHLEGSPNIPTVLYYGKENVLIGQPALRQARETGGMLNEDFKVDLGNIDPSSTRSRTTFPTSTGDFKSATQLTAEFLHVLLQRVRQWFDEEGFDIAPSVLVAEPLPSQESQTWLENYRNNIRRILRGRGFAAEKIDFLPEPFAAFQYYRYGEHTPLSQQGKRRVMVLDFGGGTFDACVIETTKAGDVSYSGTNQKPIAARSEPVGGYLINRFIAERLVEKSISKASLPYLKKGLDAYSKWRKGADDIELLAERYQVFIRHFHRLIYEVELAKLALCGQIRSWKLDNETNWTVNLRWLLDPFQKTPEHCAVQLSSREFRAIFVQRVWLERLKPILRDVISSVKAETGGAPLDFLLLSGGSANIQWLRELIIRDFGDDFDEHKILKLDDYQEVVSKGLAIECTRRFYATEGDFGSITYNPLFLSLKPDGNGAPLVRFKSDTFAEINDPGLLIPVGTNMKPYVGKPMRWKFRLPDPPNRSLGYYFFRASSVVKELLSARRSFDMDNDFHHLQNVEEQSLQVPRESRRPDSHLHLQLDTREDGTVTPTFIFAKGNENRASLELHGRSFFLDMTPVQIGPRPKAYIGLDFGTSNTAVSYVDEKKAQWIRSAAVDASWKEINELTPLLPYPIARALGLYIADHNSKNGSKRLVDFVEASLTFAAFLCYQEFRATTNDINTKLFKNFPQRSAGPLWGFLKQCLNHLPKAAVWSRPYLQFLEQQYEFDKFIEDLGKVKHEKLPLEEIAHLARVRLLANVSHQVFGDRLLFGFFEGVRQSRFGRKYEGDFRVAHGTGLFLQALRYEGSLSFAESEAFVAARSGKALALGPLMFWDECRSHTTDSPHCFMFDLVDRKNLRFEFKAAGFPCTCEVLADNQFAELASELQRMKEQDSPVQFLELGELNELSFK